MRNLLNRESSELFIIVQNKKGFLKVLHIKPKTVWACRRFSQKRNKQICFVCSEKQKSKQNKSVRLIFGTIYGAPFCFPFLCDH